MKIGGARGLLAREFNLLSELQASKNYPRPHIHRWVAPEEPHLKLTPGFYVNLYIHTYIPPPPTVSVHI